MAGDIWVINKGRTWYSERIVKEIIDLCEKAKGTNKDNSLADDILKLLDYKESKGE